MAVYQGGDFLAQQLDSIAAQDHCAWEMYVRDDGSSDSSLEILKDYSDSDKRIHLIANEQGNLGASGNFAALMRLPELKVYPYIALSDQDDIWRQDKLALQLAAMQQMEQACPDTPLLLHSDMAVVDRSLNQVASSFMAYQGIRHEESEPLNVLLAQNFVTGCTVMVNRKLLEVALPIPREALMHDGWLALCAAAFGRIGYIDLPLLQYRQHGGNEVGAKRLSGRIGAGRWLAQWRTGRANLFRSMAQAGALAERVKQVDPNHPDLAMIESYATMIEDSPLARLVTLRKNGVHMQSGIRQALMLSRLLFTPRGWHV